MGLAIDWSREFATCDPDYYKHQQRLFIEFYKAGLVYRAEANVNWDPVDGTVLANEQVIEGKGWRSGAPVERRKLSQWFFKITDYADDLLTALDRLERWPEKVRLMQKNWIGRSEGLRFSFDLSDGETVDVFSTRPDTLFGASFVALSPDHPLAERLANQNERLAAFVAECRRVGTAEEAIETAEKEGYDTGLTAAHPFDPHRKLPVYVANFVLMAYGTGAIFGCPAHDQRDLEFARKYDLPVLPVVVPEDAAAANFGIGREAYIGPGRLANSRFLDGMSVEAAKAEVARRLEAAGKGEYCCLMNSSFVAPAIRSTATRAGSMSIARNAEDPRSAKRTRATRSSIPRGISRVSATHTARGLSAARPWSIGSRLINISAGSSTPFCICFTRASSRADCIGLATRM